ncbi:uncharacterized protein LOC131647524 isoform X2 [Vicia villosa]|uniref:uncharacterized protein LOC131647524 isoform X2 n=1 Tax=Vicia villosa TaxID=3911 RepID=UPI00273ABF99|nr:uncharacterized protein LOC131647524 isoform X2 [Vicia villosa]
MLHSYLHYNHKFLFPNLPVSLTTHHFSSPSPLVHDFVHRPTCNSHTVSAINPLHVELSPWLTKLTTSTVELGTVFDAIDESSLNQVTFSVILSVAIAVLFFPTIQRRIKTAKQLVRQITITIRTVINGLCYLATFVYGINSFGLLLYSGQLAINTYVKESSSGKKSSESKIMEQSVLSNSSDEDQSSNNSQ